MKSVLLFDSNAEGHHTDYLLHLINYWNKEYNGTGYQLIVITEQAFEDKYKKHFEQNISLKWADNVLFEPINPAVVHQLKETKLSKRSFAELNLVKMYEEKYKPSRILLMYFDVFQLSIIKGAGFQASVSGIFFRPFHSSLQTSFKETLSHFKKVILMKLILRSNHLTNLFCLEESSVVYMKTFGSKINISWIPDPVEKYEIAPLELVSLKKELGILPERKVFLIFGQLDDRKGIEQSIEALALLNAQNQQKIVLILAGTIHDNYKKLINEKIAETTTEAQIITVFKGLYGKEIQLYFDISDFTLATYQKHIGSSSVVIRSMVSEKPILVSDHGYLGDFVKKYQVGITADTSSVKDIAEKMGTMLADNFSYSIENMHLLAEQNAAKNFARIIFETILGEKVD